MIYEQALRRMRSELATYGTSIPELMRALRESEKNTNLFEFVSNYIEENGPMAFCDIWKTYVKAESDYMTERENTAVLGLGDILGRYTIHEQLAAIDEVIEVLKEGKAETKMKLKEVAKLYLGTGLSLSSMLVVLLL